MKNKDFLNKLNSSVGISMPGMRPPIKKPLGETASTVILTATKPEVNISYNAISSGHPRIRGPKNRRAPAAYVNREYEPEIVKEEIEKVVAREEIVVDVSKVEETNEVKEDIKSEASLEPINELETRETKHMEVEDDKSSDIFENMGEDITQPTEVIEESATYVFEVAENKKAEPVEVVENEEDEKAKAMEFIEEIELKPVEVMEDPTKPVEVVEESTKPVEVVGEPTKPVEVVGEPTKPAEVIKEATEPLKISGENEQIVAENVKSLHTFCHHTSNVESIDKISVNKSIDVSHKSENKILTKEVEDVDMNKDQTLQEESTSTSNKLMSKSIYNYGSDSLRKHKLMRRNAKKYNKRPTFSYERRECMQENSEKNSIPDMSSSKLPIHNFYKKQEHNLKTTMKTPHETLSCKRNNKLISFVKNRLSDPGKIETGRCSPVLNFKPGFLKSIVVKSKNDHNHSTDDNISYMPSCLYNFTDTSRGKKELDSEKPAEEASSCTNYNASVANVKGSSYEHAKLESDNHMSRPGFNKDYLVVTECDKNERSYSELRPNGENNSTTNINSRHSDQGLQRLKKHQSTTTCKVRHNMTRDIAFEKSTNTDDEFEKEKLKESVPSHVYGWKPFLLENAEKLSVKKSMDEEKKQDESKRALLEESPGDTQRLDILSNFLNSIPKNKDVDYDKY